MNVVNSDKIHDRVHKEMVFFVTDMYEHEEELTHFIKRLKTLKNEVVVLHLLGSKELEFQYEGALTFKNLQPCTVYNVSIKARYYKSAYELLPKTFYTLFSTICLKKQTEEGSKFTKTNILKKM